MSDSELTSMRRIEDVVRQGRVLRIDSDRVVLAKGSVPARAGHVYVDCSAAGLRLTPGKPIFEPDMITLQAVRSCQPAFSAALVGYAEASRFDDAEKNGLCPPNPYPDAAADWISNTCISMRAQDQWLRDRDMTRWLDRSRLNAACGIRDHLTEPRMTSALDRYFANTERAITNLDAFATQSRQQSVAN